MDMLMAIGGVGVLAVIIIVVVIAMRGDAAKTVEKIDQMSGEEFENLVANLLCENGYRIIELTPKSGDFGADIIAKKAGEFYAIQCKRYSGRVGVQAVQEVVGAKLHYECENAVVVTNSFFTRQAVQLADENGVLLWDREELLLLQSKSDFLSTDEVGLARLYFHLAAEEQGELSVTIGNTKTDTATTKTLTTSAREGKQRVSVQLGRRHKTFNLNITAKQNRRFAVRRGIFGLIVSEITV